jgi:predicted dithiol-disulfide oxidoreductase (DUF899 family)
MANAHEVISGKRWLAARRSVFHTYSTYARGIDMLNLDYQYLDLASKGRDEGDRGPYWVRRHDEYGK